MTSGQATNNRYATVFLSSRATGRKSGYRLYLFICLPIYLSVYLSVYLSIYQYINLSDLSIYRQNIPFSAYDSDNDGNPSRNCAADYGGGWWYNDSCSDCNLMGELRYYALTRVPGAVNEVFWLPGLDPADFSPNSVNMFLYR